MGVFTKINPAEKCGERSKLPNKSNMSNPKTKRKEPYEAQFLFAELPLHQTLEGAVFCVLPLTISIVHLGGTLCEME